METNIKICKADCDLMLLSGDIIRITNVPTMLLPLSFLALRNSTWKRLFDYSNMRENAKKMMLLSKENDYPIILKIIYHKVIGESNLTVKDYLNELYHQRNMEFRVSGKRIAKTIRGGTKMFFEKTTLTKQDISRFRLGVPDL